MSKRKKNLICIKMEVLIQLVLQGLLKPICSAKGRANKWHSHPVNEYYRVVGVPNLVLMHVQDGSFIFINEHVTTREGEKINLVKVLAKYYWFVDTYTGSVRCTVLKNRCIQRCIGSVILYGNITNKMPTWLEVHHKLYRWCNCGECLSFICHKYHQHFHNVVNSRKSHNAGAYIKDAEEWKKMENWVRIMLLNWSRQPM